MTERTYIPLNLAAASSAGFFLASHCSAGGCCYLHPFAEGAVFRFGIGAARSFAGFNMPSCAVERPFAHIMTERVYIAESLAAADRAGIFLAALFCAGGRAYRLPLAVAAIFGFGEGASRIAAASCVHAVFACPRAHAVRKNASRNCFFISADLADIGCYIGRHAGCRDCGCFIIAGCRYDLRTAGIRAALYVTAVAVWSKATEGMPVSLVYPRIAARAHRAAACAAAVRGAGCGSRNTPAAEGAAAVFTVGTARSAALSRMSEIIMEHPAGHKMPELRGCARLFSLAYGAYILFSSARCAGGGSRNAPTAEGAAHR